MPTWAKIVLIVAGVGIVALFILKSRASVAGGSAYTGTSYNNTVTPAGNGSSANGTADALNNALSNLNSTLSTTVRNSGKTVASITSQGSPPVPVVTYTDGTTISGGGGSAIQWKGSLSLIPPAASAPQAAVPPSTGPATATLKGPGHF